MPETGLKVSKTHANRVHKLLLENNFFNKARKPLRENDFVIFPIKNKSKEILSLAKKVDSAAVFTEKKFETRAEKPKNLKAALLETLSEKELFVLQTAHDSLGDCAIIEVPKELEKKARVIGEALLKTKPSFKSVFMKTGAHQGVFREEPVKLIAGKKTGFAHYKEAGCAFRISLGKVFFSPRLSTERLRIAKQIKKGEKIAALFAGVGPFPIVFAKNSRMEMAVAIELNPVAVEDMKHNLALNKVCEKIEPVLGDVKKLASKYEALFDRAVMPLPKGGENFLEDAIRYLKPEGGVVHYYQFAERADPYTLPLNQVKAACEKLGRKFRVLNKKQVREFSKGTIQIVMDVKVWAEQ